MCVLCGRDCQLAWALGGVGLCRQWFLSGCVLWGCELSIGPSCVGVIVRRLVPGSGRCWSLGMFPVTDGLPGVLSPAEFSGVYCQGWRWPCQPCHPLLPPHLHLGLPGLDLPGLAPALSSTLCERPLQRHPQSRLLSVRLWPKQPFRALFRARAASSISLLNYAGAVVGRSTLAGPG